MPGESHGHRSLAGYGPKYRTESDTTELTAAAGKTTRSFRYDLNQTPYDYTVGVRNRFKGLDPIECLINYGQRLVTLYRRQGSRPTHGKEMQKTKMAV